MTAAEAGRWWCRTGRRRRSVRTLLRRGETEKEAGKVWCHSGVVLAFYRGRGSTGVEMPVGNGQKFTTNAIEGRGGC
jgi:hypothetical protein